MEHLIDQDIAIDATGGEISCYREDGPEILGDEAAWLQEKFRPDVSLPENYGFPQVPVKFNEPWTVRSSRCNTRIHGSPKWLLIQKSHRGLAY